MKITDFGLAAFSQKRDEDPWTGEAKADKHGNPFGVLCAQFEGGTPEYFSPQQRLIVAELDKVRGEEARREFSERWLLTAPTSDLYQAAMTILEMHAMFLPAPGSEFDSAKRCASRTPTHEIRALSKEDSERWLEHKQIAMLPKLKGKLEGKLVEHNVDGAKLIEWKQGDHKAGQKTLGLNMASAKQLHDAIRRHISTPANEMRAEICTLVTACLTDDVCKRPGKAGDALQILGASSHESGEVRDVTQTCGYTSLPTAAKKKSSEHADTNIESTFGSLAKSLVHHEAYADALDVCAEWLGVSSTKRGRARAIDAYCNLWKRYGNRLPKTLDLSRKSRGHWKESMLRRSHKKEIFIMCLARNMAYAGVRPSLEKIDFSEQPALEGPVLEVLFGVESSIWRVSACAYVCQSSTGRHSRIAPEHTADRRFSDLADEQAYLEDGAPDQAPSKLCILSLQNCRRLTPGRIPSIISCCKMLQVLNLRNCNRTGPPLPETLRLLVPLACTLEMLNLGGNKLGGRFTSDIEAFTKLKTLVLNDMRIQGVTVVVSSCFHITTHSMPSCNVAANNRATGNLPELGNLAQLRVFDVRNNALTGGQNPCCTG